MYSLDEVDRAGNRFTIFEHEDLAVVRDQFMQKTLQHPHSLFLVSNDENVDIGWRSGLTEEEKEQF
jgi:hypothetical protein